MSATPFGTVAVRPNILLEELALAFIGFEEPKDNVAGLHERHENKVRVPSVLVILLLALVGMPFLPAATANSNVTYVTTPIGIMPSSCV